MRRESRDRDGKAAGGANGCLHVRWSLGNAVNRGDGAQSNKNRSVFALGVKRRDIAQELGNVPNGTDYRWLQRPKHG